MRGGRAEAGVCVRRRSNFLLPRQEKVTKEKATLHAASLRFAAGNPRGSPPPGAPPDPPPPLLLRPKPRPGATPRGSRPPPPPPPPPPAGCPFATRRGRRLGVALSLVTFFRRRERKLPRCRARSPASAHK